MSHDDNSDDRPDNGPDDVPMAFSPAITADLARVLSSLDEAATETAGPADLAALIEGGLTADEADIVLAHADDRARVEAAADFLAEVAARSGQPPASLMQAARDLLAPARPRASADIVQLRASPPAPAPVAANDVEVFQLLAAATRSDDASIVCRSQSGIWTLEVFVSPDDANKGYLLLSVHPDHRATYEGRTGRVFVKLGENERVLAEEVVRKGEIYTAISLAGLDLHARDAINVTFA